MIAVVNVSKMQAIGTSKVEPFVHLQALRWNPSSTCCFCRGTLRPHTMIAVLNVSKVEAIIKHQIQNRNPNNMLCAEHMSTNQNRLQVWPPLLFANSTSCYQSY